VSPKLLFIFPFLLLSIGVWTLSSLENSLNWSDPSSWLASRAFRQVIFSLVAILVSWVLVYWIKFQKSQKLIFWFNIITSFINILVIIIDYEIRGASRWLRFGGFSLQPSELLKVSLILWTAFYASYFDLKKQINLVWFWSFPTLSFLTIWNPSFGQSDLGTAIVTVFPAVIIFLIQPDINKKIKTGFVALVTLIILFLSVNLTGYQQKRLDVLNFAFRIENWAPSSSDDINKICNQTTLYNTCQSISLIANNQLIGNLESFQTNRSLFLPERQTDFIFASISHYVGILGSFTVLLVYFLFFLLLSKLLQVSKNYQFYLILGAGSSLLFQVIANISMNQGLIPVVGVPLPWLSYGGSHILGTFLLLFIITYQDKNRFTS